jgi:hypothetical protein
VGGADAATTAAAGATGDAVTMSPIRADLQYPVTIVHDAGVPGAYGGGPIFGASGYRPQSQGELERSFNIDDGDVDDLIGWTQQLPS